MLYEGTFCIIESPIQGDIFLNKNTPYYLKCQKNGKQSQLEILSYTDKNNRENISIENIYLIGQHLNLDKNEVSKLLGKIKKESPNEVLGFRPSKRNRMISNFYEKYFQELNSYGVSLISLKQLMDGHFFNMYKTVVAKDIITIPFEEIPTMLNNPPEPIREKEKNIKFSLDFILNKKRPNESPSSSEDQPDYLDSGENQQRNKRGKRKICANNISINNNLNNNSINNNFNNNFPNKFNSQRRVSTNKEININIRETITYGNDFQIPLSNFTNFTNSTYNIFSNSKFGEQLKDYIPVDDLNLLQYNFDPSFFNVKNISIFHQKKGDHILYHIENQIPNFDEMPSDSKFLELSVKKNELFPIELKVKFDIPNKVVSLFNGEQKLDDINGKSKISLQEFIKDPPYKKIFKFMKLMLGHVVLVVPILVNIVDFN